jgi:hypothetical protein
MKGKDWRLVCFDLDGTLVLGTTVSQHLADRLGHGALLADLERLTGWREKNGGLGRD